MGVLMVVYVYRRTGNLFNYCVDNHCQYFTLMKGEIAVHTGKEHLHHGKRSYLRFVAKINGAAGPETFKNNNTFSATMSISCRSVSSRSESRFYEARKNSTKTARLLSLVPQIIMITANQTLYPLPALNGTALNYKWYLNRSYRKIGPECYYRSLITLLYKQARLWL